MKQIDKMTGAAFRAGVTKHLGNTSVVAWKGCQDNAVQVYLFGNLIAERRNGFTRFQSCGYNTATTRNRLNACGLDCRIKKGRLITPDGEPVPARF